MKKLLWALALVLVIVGAWGMAAFATGQKMEKKYYALLNDLSAQGGGISLASKNYQRGLLRSQAVTEVRFDLPSVAEVAAGGVRFEIVHDLQHGFLPAATTADGRRHWLPVLAIVDSRLAESEGNRELLTIAPELAKGWSSSVVDFQGGSATRFDIPGLRREFGEGSGVFAWGGMAGEVTASEDLGKVSGTVRLPKIEFAVDGAGVRLEEGSSEFTMEKAFESLYLGNTKGRLGHLVVQLPENDEPVDFADIRIEVDSRQDGHLVEFGEVIELKDVTAGQRSLGSGRLDLQIRNINGPALAKFYGDLQAIQKRGLAEEAAAAAVQQTLFELIGGLSTDAPQIEIRQLQISAPQGRLDGHALLRLTGKEKITMENLFSAFPRLQGEAEVKIGRDLALAFIASAVEEKGEEGGKAAQVDLAGAAREKAKALLAVWTGQKMLIDEGDNLKVAAGFRDGEFTVNGQPFGGGM